MPARSRKSAARKSAPTRPPRPRQEYGTGSNFNVHLGKTGATGFANDMPVGDSDDEWQFRLIFTCARCDNEVTEVVSTMNKVDGIEIFPTQANFILFKTTQKPADEVFESLKNQKVLIKNLSKPSSSLKNCLRVTVGRPDENDKFISALKTALTS